MKNNDQQIIRQLFDDYIQMYSSRDDQLTTHFSEDFSGFTGGGDFLVKKREEWVAITRQDFAQIKDPIHIELKDLAIQSLAETIAVATGFFTIKLPVDDQILSRETARLVLMFRLESAGWKITHSSISIPYHLVREGEVYPMQELTDRNRFLEKMVSERTAQLFEAKEKLEHINEELTREITRHKHTEEVLEESESTYRSILDASPDAITITDLEGSILMVSPTACKMFSYNAPEDIIGRSVLDFIVPADHKRAKANIRRILNRDENSGPKEYRGIRQDGSLFGIELNSGLILGAQGQPTKIVIIVRDITKRKQTEQRIQKLVQQLKIERDTARLNAVTDSLTGLANRRYFDDTIKAEFYRLKRSGASLSLIMVDIDHFKQFNDLYGHLAGDNCLKVVATTLQTVICRVPDVIARYGGEEFVVMLPETDQNGAVNLAQQMKEAIEEQAIPHGASQTAHHVTISLGVVTVSTSETLVTPEQVVAMADNALYSAKKNGRNRYVVFNTISTP